MLFHGEKGFCFLTVRFVGIYNCENLNGGSNIIITTTTTTNLFS